ncbi:MAG: low molecular weight phosphotyrosine protein phosphatase [Prevotella sp.]|nr:low molecular weight phosphotyrosine protein phosphatase [Prevotella sp.]MCM1075477.1 low molecular weight phosphotyrosine protein phosphatase [Ruminococcus sp.]
MKANKTDKVRILFVCLGNICRSPAAQGVMQQMVDAAGLSDRYLLDSAGTYAGHAGELPDKRMRVHAARRGYTLTHRSRPVHASDFEDFDIIVAMDDSNYENLRRMAPTADDEKKIVRMIDYCRQHPYYYSVPDPYYEGASGFELVLDLLEDACTVLLDATKP